MDITHLIEKRFASVFNPSKNKKEMLSIVLKNKEHQAFTNEWRKALPYGKKATQKQVITENDKRNKNRWTILD
jgi:hypothetical protein